MIVRPAKNRAGGGINCDTERASNKPEGLAIRCMPHPNCRYNTSYELLVRRFIGRSHRVHGGQHNRAEGCRGANEDQ